MFWYVNLSMPKIAQECRACRYCVNTRKCVRNTVLQPNQTSYYGCKITHHPGSNIRNFRLSFSTNPKFKSNCRSVKFLFGHKPDFISTNPRGNHLCPTVEDKIFLTYDKLLIYSTANGIWWIFFSGFLSTRKFSLQKCFLSR